MGQAIRELGWKRSDLVISTKIFWGGPGPNDKGLSRKHIVEGTKASLKRLDTDYVDILYCHRPDSATPIEETVRAMNYVIDHGWAFYWGTSEWSAQQITEAWGVAQRLDLVGPVVEQPEYNLFNRHKVMGFSPFLFLGRFLVHKQLHILFVKIFVAVAVAVVVVCIVRICGFSIWVGLLFYFCDL